MKVKRLLIMVIGAFFIMGSVMVYAVYQGETAKPVFMEDGYLLSYGEDSDDKTELVHYFREGTTYADKYPQKIVFKDTEGTKVVADKQAFIHYNSGALCSLTDSVLIDLKEVEASAVNYYGLNADTLIERIGSRYYIKSRSGDIDFDRILWKMGENRYLLLAQNISVSFADGKTIQFPDYVELYYYESGMVAFLSADGVWKTASADCRISVGDNISINATNKTILVDDGVRMSMEQMVADADTNINILPAGYSDVVIRVPEFDIKVVDGANGTDGIKGKAGKAGEEGKAGEAGETGEQGEAGEAGQRGENGEAGKKGTTGETGKTGETGQNGLEGEIGEQGNDGNAGSSGSAGRTGTTGQTGANGINGADGADGYQGQSGDEGVGGAGGAGGRAGTTGITGTTGVNGENGTDGNKGTDGLAGVPGIDQGTQVIEAPTDVLAELPKITVNDFVVTATTIGGELVVTENEGNLYFSSESDETDIVLELLDGRTGILVDQYRFGRNDTIREFNFVGLTQDYPYQLMVTASYSVKEIPYRGIFYNRQIYTDTVGLGISVALVTEDSITFEVKKNHATFYSVECNLTDSEQNEINSATINFSDRDTALVTFHEMRGASNVFLDSDTYYYFSITDIDGSTNIPVIYSNYAVKTLKKHPSVVGASVYVNKKANAFELSTDSVTDIDNCITRYRYEIYNSMNTDEPVKTILSTQKRGVLCYVDGVTINKNDSYRLKVVAEGYDNVKKVEVSTVYSEPFSMGGFSSYPYIVVVAGASDATNYPNKFECNLTIHCPGSCHLDTTKPVIIRYKNTYNEENALFFNPETLSESVTVNQAGENVYALSFVISNMKQGENYIFSAYGSIDFGDGIVNDNQLIDSISIKTPMFQTLSAQFVSPSQTTTAMAFTMRLKKPAGAALVGNPVNNHEYALREAKKVTIRLYDGKPNGVGVTLADLRLVETITTDVTYESSLNEAVTAQITEHMLVSANTASFTTGFYTAEVISAQDGTDHANVIPVENIVFSGTLKVTYPSFESVSLDVTAITADNISAYITEQEYTDWKISDYDAMTVFGYAVRAAGLEGKHSLFRSIEYYCYDAVDYTANKLVNELNTDAFYPTPDNSFMVRVTQPISGAQTPMAVFLFNDMGLETSVKQRNEKQVLAGDANDVTANVTSPMSRGRDYVFTVRLKTTDAYFPEILGSAYKRVIRKTGILNAPYERPAYFFYPWTSTANSTTWKYYIKAMDEAVISGNFTTSRGTFAAGSGVPKLNLENQELTLSLTNNGTVRLTIPINRYVYDTTATTDNLPIFYYEKKQDWVAAAGEMFVITPQVDLNRFMISTTLDSEERASRVAAVIATVSRSGDPSSAIEIPIEISSVTNTDIVGYLSFSKIESLFNNSIEISIKVLYDNGVSGLDTKANTQYGIQIMSTDESINGLYIIPNNTATALATSTYQNARNSSFLLSNMQINREDFSLTIHHPLYGTFEQVISDGIFNSMGARSSTISYNYITFKELQAYPVPSSEGTPVYTYNFEAMNAVIDLNEGARLTIDTTADSATVHWNIAGQSAVSIHESMIYFDLFELIGDSNTSTSYDLIRSDITTVLQNGVSSYNTSILGLDPSKHYAIQIYYYQDAAAKLSHDKSYPIDGYRPDVPPNNVFFPFATGSAIAVTNSSCTYVAEGYQNKILQFDYTLQLTSGFDVVYALYKEVEGVKTLVWSHRDLTNLGFMTMPNLLSRNMSAQLDFRPGVLKDNTGAVITSETADQYYLRVIPVSISRNAYTGSTQESYHQWISSCYIGSDPEYFVRLHVGNLEKPYYYVRMLANSTTQLRTRISVSDPDYVMVNGLYRVCLFGEGGEDVTPDTVKKKEYGSDSAVNVEFDGLKQGKTYTVVIYSVYDLVNSGGISAITSIPYGNLNQQDGLGNYLYRKFSTTGRLTSSEYSIGSIQLAEVQNRVRIDFIDSLNLSAITRMIGTIVSPGGESVSFSVNNPSTQMVELSVSGNMNRYGYLLPEAYSFSKVGEYVFNLRFYAGTAIQDVSVTYYKQ